MIGSGDGHLMDSHLMDGNIDKTDGKTNVVLAGRKIGGLRQHLRYRRENRQLSGDNATAGDLVLKDVGPMIKLIVIEGMTDCEKSVDPLIKIIQPRGPLLSHLDLILQWF